MSAKKRFGLLFAICMTFYIGAFAVVHSSSALRRPAYNMAFWYYSDNSALEAVEFYGFWPLRQAWYKISDTPSRHISERTWQTQEMPPVFQG